MALVIGNFLSDLPTTRKPWRSFLVRGEQALPQFRHYPSPTQPPLGLHTPYAAEKGRFTRVKVKGHWLPKKQTSLLVLADGLQHLGRGHFLITTSGRTRHYHTWSSFTSVATLALWRPPCGLFVFLSKKFSVCVLLRYNSHIIKFAFLKYTT